MGAYTLVSIEYICRYLLDGSYNYDVEGNWSGIQNSWGANCPSGGGTYPCNNSTDNFDSKQCDIHYGGTLSGGG